MFTGVKLCTFSISEPKIWSQPANLSSNLLIMWISWSERSGTAVRDGQGCSTFTTSLASLQYAAPTRPSHLGKDCSSVVGDQIAVAAMASGTQIYSMIHDRNYGSIYYLQNDALELGWKVLCMHNIWCARVNQLCGILMYITPKAWESMAVILS